jgi:hypothetical protein
MARRDAAGTERFAPAVAVAVGDVSLLGMFAAACSLCWREFLPPYVPPSPPVSCIVHFRPRVFPFVRLAAECACYHNNANSPKFNLYSTYMITPTSTIRKPSPTSTSPLSIKTPEVDHGDKIDAPGDGGLPDGYSDSDSDSSYDSNTDGSNANDSNSDGTTRMAKAAPI